MLMRNRTYFCGQEKGGEKNKAGGFIGKPAENKLGWKVALEKAGFRTNSSFIEII